MGGHRDELLLRDRLTPVNVELLKGAQPEVIRVSFTLGERIASQSEVIRAIFTLGERIASQSEVISGHFYSREAHRITIRGDKGHLVGL